MKIQSAVLWVPVDVVAAHIGSAKNFVSRWFDVKRPLARTVGTFRKFKLSEVDDWVLAGRASRARTWVKQVRRTTTIRKKSK